MSNDNRFHLECLQKHTKWQNFYLLKVQPFILRVCNKKVLSFVNLSEKSMNSRKKCKMTRKGGTMREDTKQCYRMQNNGKNANISDIHAK